MREVIRRRYTRLQREAKPLPDLIVIDGGRGQLAAALSVIEGELGLDVPVCGLAKDDRHRTSQLFFMDEESPVALDRHSQAFYLLERIQDEVHRFAIEFHRQQRRKTGFASVLDDIPGVGPERKRRCCANLGASKPWPRRIWTIFGDWVLVTNWLARSSCGCARYWMSEVRRTFDKLLLLRHRFLDSAMANHYNLKSAKQVREPNAFPGITSARRI
ncbi:hypothetical protein GCM10025858_04540 [Alicyclobacillus sacchari]|nr:hypothetical protein GCM10025858_04540 [Alicyclobacillus sacchari]